MNNLETALYQTQVEYSPINLCHIEQRQEAIVVLDFARTDNYAVL